MARNVTVTQMIQRVRRRTDKENSARRTTDQEIVDNLTEGIAELYDVVRGAFGQDYFRAAFPFNTANGTEIYSLPADFLSLLSVDVAFSNSIVVTARPYMENERNIYKTFPLGWLLGAPIWYRLYAANIKFIPAPNGVFPVTLNYCPTSPNLLAGCSFNADGSIASGGGQAFDGVAGWEEYAILDAAIKCLVKDEDTDILGILDERKERMRQRILDYAPERDAGQPERVHDVYGGGPIWGGWGDGKW